MTTKLLLALKKWATPILVAYTLVLTIFSLVHLSDIPSLGYSFDDKIYHGFAYFVFTLIAYNFFKQKRIPNAIMISALSVSIFGIIIEVLQFTMTSYRTLDIYDILANTLGAVISAVVLRFLNNTKLK
jgi:VanZ family protein